MATSKQEKDCEISTLSTQCSLCSETFSDPRILPCQHSFCTPCLETQKNTSLELGEPMRCISCQMCIHDDIKNLPVNFVDGMLKEAGQGVENCDSCSFVDKQIIGTHKCLDCGDILCSSCNELHCRPSTTRHHKVVPLEDLSKGKFMKEYKDRKIINCPKHSGSKRKIPFENYCEDCDSLVCFECTAKEHQRHKICTIKEASEKQQVVGMESINGLLGYQTSHKNFIQNIEDHINNSKDKKSKQESDIYRKSTSLHDLIDKIKISKLKELTDHYDKGLNHLNQILANEKNMESRIEATVGLMVAFMDLSSPVEYLFHKNDLLQRIDSIPQAKKFTFTTNSLALEGTMEEGAEKVIEDIIGTMIAQQREVSINKEIGAIKEVFKTKVDMESVTGLAITDSGNILVTSSSHPKIQVLDNNGKIQSWIECPNLKIPWDIHVEGDNIYVTDVMENDRKIIIMDKRGRVKKEIKLPEYDQQCQKSLGIYVMPNQDIYVASAFTETVYKCEKDQSIPVPYVAQRDNDKIKGPFYLCKTPEDEVVISNLMSGSTLVYDMTRELIQEYNHRDGSSVNKSPSGICCDQQGFIYIADFLNPKIEIVKNGESICCLDLGKQVEKVTPVALTYERDLVYAYKNNVVKIKFWE